jgi:hypothetical protein
VLIPCQRLGGDPDDYLTEVFAVDTAKATDEQIIASERVIRQELACLGYFFALVMFLRLQDG